MNMTLELNVHKPASSSTDMRTYMEPSCKMAIDHTEGAHIGFRFPNMYRVCSSISATVWRSGRFVAWHAPHPTQLIPQISDSSIRYPKVCTFRQLLGSLYFGSSTWPRRLELGPLQPSVATPMQRFILDANIRLFNWCTINILCLTSLSIKANEHLHSWGLRSSFPFLLNSSIFMHAHYKGDWPAIVLFPQLSGVAQGTVSMWIDAGLEGCGKAKSFFNSFNCGLRRRWPWQLFDTFTCSPPESDMTLAPPSPSSSPELSGTRNYFNRLKLFPNCQGKLLAAHCRLWCAEHHTFSLLYIALIPPMIPLPLPSTSHPNLLHLAGDDMTELLI